MIPLCLLLAPLVAAIPVDVTPHESYSSTVGVPGCKINTNRVAYWPLPISCTNICVRVTYAGRSLHLLRIDRSTGAWDISYDAWNYLLTGQSARDNPSTGSILEADYEEVDADECVDLMYSSNGGLPMSAANSMDYLRPCLEDEPDSWVARHFESWNIHNPVCTQGWDERCTLDLKKSNWSDCPNPVGEPRVLTTAPVWNVQYGTGEEVLAV